MFIDVFVELCFIQVFIVFCFSFIKLLLLLLLLLPCKYYIMYCNLLLIVS